MHALHLLSLTDAHRKRFELLYQRYKRLYTDPENCTPMFIVNTPLKNVPPWEDRLNDPLLMLQAELDALRPHLEMEDDRVPTVRVQFGTGQVAAAFGCEMFMPPDSFPCAGSHVLANAEEVYTLQKPAFDAGWYGKLKDYTAIFQEHLPEGVHIQHPDIQSPFNTSHLVRGNGILMDFYDQPETVKALLDLVTDYMIDLTLQLKTMISNDREWFFDWGALWKGTARISNCSMHMISPQFYAKYVLPRDIRFMHAIGGGRVHYCGTSDAVIDDFFKNPEISGLDYDEQYHSLWDLSERAPKHLTLLCDFGSDPKPVQRLLRGDWPRKRNIIITWKAASVAEGKNLLARLRQSVPD